MYTHNGTEIQTHGFTAQSFGFKGRLLNHIVSLLPKQTIANHSRFDVNCLPVVTSYHILSILIKLEIIWH